MSSSVITLPYSQSRPLILAGRLTATLAAGKYTWNGDLFDASPQVELKAASLYLLTSVTFAADLDAATYSDAIDPTYTTSPIPSFRILQLGGSSVLPDAIPVPSFFSDLGLCYPFSPKVNRNRIQFSAQGRLDQTPALVGKASVSLSITCLVYEVSDLNWINRFMRSTPPAPLPPGVKALPGAREQIIMDRPFREEVFG